MRNSHFRLRYIFVPHNPHGTALFHLQSTTRQGAIEKLLKDSAHLPYKTWENFALRGYTVQKVFDPAQSRK